MANYEALLDTLNKKLNTDLTMLQIFQAIIAATEPGETHEFVKYLDSSGCDECVKTKSGYHNVMQMEMIVCDCGTTCKLHKCCDCIVG